ncbi:unnamed protein product [Zymoseptoria tritici ST99CH_1A5]|uniref:Integrase zinc-binding domain-containing protein n=1 Tax=Zymoseptoria tritici ST99CH_1A5 TaxID=1276529 RepID=A0A1Y6LP79_ZYMTR|nr:unnamed protein product [Zymoseptoria tritici ST99CH_1A5]
MISDDDLRYGWLDDILALFSSVRNSSNYVNTVLSLSPEFISQVKHGYTLNRSWRRMLTVLETVLAEADLAARQAANELPPTIQGPYTRDGRLPLDPSAHSSNRCTDGINARQLWRLLDGETDPAVDPGLREGLRFFLEDGLIYYVNPVNRQPRLCVPPSLQHEIFESAHDIRHHAGIQRCLDRINATFYLKDCKRELEDYIAHCTPCRANQTLRHLPNGFLHPIDVPTLPMDVQCADWIVKLPPTNEGFDSLLTITCKKSKRVLLIASKGTWTA